MEYVKLIGGGFIEGVASDTKARELDTHGLMAKIRPVDGDIRIVYGALSEADGYMLKAGETFDFVGCMRFYGTAGLEYLLFDKA